MKWINLILTDLAFGTYSFHILMSSYAFLLFFYWAIKSSGRASAWYYYVMGLLLANITTDAYQVYVRYLFFTDNPLYRETLLSWSWAMRIWIGAAITTAVAVHATYRMIKSRNKL